MDLREFARWAIVNGPFDACSLDGMDVQEKALECGILVETKYDPDVHGQNSCGAEAGDEWYVFSDEFNKLKKAT